MLQCDTCTAKWCTLWTTGEKPDNCPSDNPAHEAARDDYASTELDREVIRNSHYAVKYGFRNHTRVEQIMSFARISGYTKIGVAFCMSFVKEAAIFCDVLRDNGFEVESLVCKTGGIDMKSLGSEYLDDLPRGMTPSICNPTGQAYVLNQAHTDLNVVLGLCVGHDGLFMKHSEAPCTYLACKDSVTGHNPLTPLYEHEGAWERIHHAQLPTDGEIAAMRRHGADCL